MSGGFRTGERGERGRGAVRGSGDRIRLFHQRRGAPNFGIETNLPSPAQSDHVALLTVRRAPTGRAMAMREPRKELVEIMTEV